MRMKHCGDPSVLNKQLNQSLSKRFIAGRMSVALGVQFIVPLTIVGCGGKADCGECIVSDSGVATDSGISTDSGAPDFFPSEAALSDARNDSGMPENVRLISIRSGPGGVLRPDGTDDTWVATFLDDSEGQAYVGTVSASGPMLDPRSSAFECPGPALMALDSTEIVPDAVSRVEGAAEGVPTTIYLALHQEADCIVNDPATGPFTRSGHMVTVTRRFDDRQEMWFAHYDDAGSLLDLCGPCASSLWRECASCQ
jgi:hypothetical protein